ncbi:LpqB family beta-propeller domain-containing protein [Catellatospora methionotrophica]|uniref:LpqB family beta-propeller domain-containing protein n=1 Tax=Catellatospora methionotrophica TaxID=121620 RepID=UPI0034051997
MAGRGEPAAAQQGGRGHARPHRVVLIRVRDGVVARPDGVSAASRTSALADGGLVGEEQCGAPAALPPVGLPCAARRLVAQQREVGPGQAVVAAGRAHAGYACQRPAQLKAVVAAPPARFLRPGRQVVRQHELETLREVATADHRAGTHAHAAGHAGEEQPGAQLAEPPADLAEIAADGQGRLGEAELGTFTAHDAERVAVLVRSRRSVAAGVGGTVHVTHLVRDQRGRQRLRAQMRVTIAHLHAAGSVVLVDDDSDVAEVRQADTHVAQIQLLGLRSQAFAQRCPFRLGDRHLPPVEHGEGHRLPAAGLIADVLERVEKHPLYVAERQMGDSGKRGSGHEQYGDNHDPLRVCFLIM